MRKSFTLAFGAVLACMQAFAQCPIGLMPGTVELVVNGDFSGGNTGFSSQYTYCNTLDCQIPEGMYGVGTDPSFYNGAFVGSDHTTGSGDFMVVNGDANPIQVWCQTINGLETNKFYVFSYWISTLVVTSPALIQAKVNGLNLGFTFPAPFATNTWAQFSFPWNSGTNTTATICLYNNNTALNGNDFGIDDISFVKCECDLFIEAGTGGTICKGDSIQLDGSGAISYFWYPISGLSCLSCEDPIAFPDTTTWFYASVNGAADCFAYDSVLVEVFPGVDLNAQPDTTVCPGESVQLSSGGAEEYHWLPEDGLSDANIPNPVAAPSDNTTYYLHAIDQYGCDQYDSVELNLFAASSPPTAFPDTILCEGHSAQLVAGGGVTYSWFPTGGLSCTDCSNPVATIFETTVYTVSTTDENGCAAGEASVTLTLDPLCIYYGLPNAFSPNQDGRNDFFNILGAGIATYEISIYNRWGEMIFYTSERTNSWDGTYLGEEQPVGVYIWRLEVNLIDGRSDIKTGNVTLVR